MFTHPQIPNNPSSVEGVYISMFFVYDVGACPLLPAFNDEHVHPPFHKDMGLFADFATALILLQTTRERSLYSNSI